MTTRYLLEQRVMGPHLQVEISEERYRNLAEARESLSEALYFEQRYELLLGNFLALEAAFTEIGLRAAAEYRYAYAKSSAEIEIANRHVVNQLTAMRSYADQVVQDFKCLPMEPSFAEVAKSELSALYDRSRDYQFCCELRNYVQHKASAIHGFEQRSGPGEDPNEWVEAVRLYTLKATLGTDRKFKERVLQAEPDKIDVRRRVRRSVQGLGAVHISLRKLTAERVNQARSTAEAAIADYKAAGAESALGLAACCRNSSDGVVPVLLDWDDVRMQLAAKNEHPVDLWPRRTHAHPKPEKILKMRLDANLTQVQAASRVFVSSERWQDYEDGLPMPIGLFHLFELQLGCHSTHKLQPLN